MSQHCVAFKEVHPPTALTHCCAGHFLTAARQGHLSGEGAEGDRRPQLVVAGGTRLTLFAVSASPVTGDAFLETLSQQRLFGVVEGLEVLSASAGSGRRDALLLTFRTAKLVVLVWDAQAGELVVTSLHDFESAPALGRQPSVQAPALAADPQGRGAAVRVSPHCVAVVPALESEDHLDALSAPGEDASAPFATSGNSYFLPTKRLQGRQVRDLCFLHGYNEPVLLLLLEAEPGWVGTYAVARDGLRLLALSVDALHQRHAKLWGAEGLPSDALKVVGVPSGGVLTLTPTLAIIHHQGSVATVTAHSAASVVPSLPVVDVYSSYGDPLHALTQHASRFCTASSKDTLPKLADGAPASAEVSCDLQGSTGAWLDASTFLLAGSQGSLMLLKVLRTRDGKPDLALSRTGALSSSPPAALCRLGERTLFAASASGSSCLLKYQLEGSPNGVVQEAAATGRKRTRDDEAVVVPSTQQGQPGSEAGSSGRYCFRVLDTLAGTCPVRSLCLGKAGSAAEDQLQPPIRPVLLATGQGESGAGLTLTQQVVPSVITPISLPGVVGLWAVLDNSSVLEDSRALASAESFQAAERHGYLFIASEQETRVLRTGEDLEEVPGEANFETRKRTVAAASVLGGARIVQVCPEHILYLKGTQAIQTLFIATVLGGVGVDTTADASFTDAYVLLRTSGQRAVLLKAEQGGLHPLEGLASALQEAGVEQRISACCLYADQSGALSAATRGAAEQTFCILCTQQSSLLLFGVDSAALLLRFDDAASGHEILAGSGQQAEPPRAISDALQVVEVCVVSFTRQERSASWCERPVLLLRLSDSTLLAYQCLAYPSGGLAPRPSVAWRRLQLDWLPHCSPGDADTPRSQRLFPFTRLGLEAPFLYSGVFVAGSRPCWLVAARGTLVAHPMTVEGRLVGFTPFNNVNCPQGFITATTLGLCIAQLPLRTHLDTPWPLQRSSLRVTPGQVAYLADEDLLVHLATRKVGPEARPPQEPGGDPQASYAYACACERAKQQPATEARAEVRLLHSRKWTVAWRYTLAAEERALAVAPVRLRSGTDTLRSLFCVGTGSLLGEDHPTEGRLLLFHVTRQHAKGDSAEQAAAGGAASTVTATLACDPLGLQGAVTALAQGPDGLLAAAVGPRLELFVWDSSQRRLVLQAFLDGQLLVTSLTAVKNYFLLGDMHKGLTFVKCSDRGKKLEELGREYYGADVRALAYLVRGQKLLLAAWDGAGTARLLAYDPEHGSTFKGKKLLSLASFHLGSPVRAATALSVAPPRGTSARLQAALAGDATGALHLVVPLWEEVLPQAPLLRQLSAALALQARHAAGLHPLSFRRRQPSAAGWSHQTASKGSKGTAAAVDLDLLFSYQYLPVERQVAVASRLSTSRGEILGLLNKLAEALPVL